MSEWWSADPVAGQGAGAPAPAFAQAPTLDPAHRDMAIRTVYGEAANEPDLGQAAVASVIKNRVDSGRYGGTDVPSVVLAKNQFEPWNNPAARARMVNLSQNDPRYQKIGGIVDQVFSGQMEDPTNGSTHFVAPAAQAALGRQMPSWAQGEGLPIGRHTFFAPEGRVQTASATGGNWWAGDPVAGGDAPASGGGQFMAPLPDGGNARVAREGMSPPAGVMGKLAQMWENPPPGGLMSVIKPMVQASQLPGDVMSGKTQMPSTLGLPGTASPEVGQATYEPNAIGKMFLPEGAQWQAPAQGSPFAQATTLAGATPMASAPGGIFAAPVGKGIEAAAPAVSKAIPTAAELKAAATGAEGYGSEAIKDLAVKPAAVQNWAQQTKATLNQSGLDDVVAPGTFKILDKLEGAPPGSFVSGQSLDSLRKTLGNVARETADGRPTPNATAATRAMTSLDEFIPSIATKDVVSGEPAAAAQAWQAARGNYAAAMRSESIDRKVIQAENRAAASNSGQNVANTVRQRLATVLNDPAQLAGYTASERQLIEKVVKGTATGNTLRFAGNLLGGGGGLGMVAAGTAGALATGGPGIVAPAVGFALKSLSNRMTLNQAAKLSEAVRSRAPLASAMNDFSAKAVEFSQAQTPRSMAAVTLAARNLSNNLKDAGIALSPNDILRSLQGPVKSAADQDQQR